METARVIVVGGGISGLSAAHRLSERLSILGRPFEITLLEASDRVGGVIATQSHNGFLLEFGPDCFLESKSRGVGLCNDIGLGRDLIPTESKNRRSFVAWNGKLTPMPEGFHLIAPTQLAPMLLTPLLSIQGKLRLINEFFMKGAPPEDESIGSFVRRRFGPEIAERLAQPLIGNIYGADIDRVSLRATFPKFLELEKKGSVLKGLGQKKDPAEPASGARYSMFVTLKEGMQTLVDRLQERLGGARIELNSVVQTIKPAEPKGWRVTLKDGRVLDADGICLATPAAAVARLFQPLDSAASALFAQIPCSDSLITHFAFPENAIKHPMNGFGFVVPAAEKRALGACTFVHRKFPGRAPQGYALLRAFACGPAAAALKSTPVVDIERKLLGELSLYLGIRGKPIFSQTHRWMQSMPQYSVGHIARLKQIDERLYQWKDLSIAGNWRRGVGIPDCVESGEQAADTLVNALCRL